MKAWKDEQEKMNVSMKLNTVKETGFLITIRKGQEVKRAA